MNHVFAQLSKSNASFLKYATAEIPAEAFTKQHTHLPNHPAWTVGHLTFVRAAIPLQLGQPGPVQPDNRYGPGSQPTSDASAYPTKEKLLADFDAAEAHLQKLIASLTPEQLEMPTPHEGLRKSFPLVKDLLLNMLSFHDGMHLGQLVDWRRAQGLPRLIA
jgi:hypothetical protein